MLRGEWRTTTAPTKRGQVRVKEEASDIKDRVKREGRQKEDHVKPG